jgi:hypothetical protein
VPAQPPAQDAVRDHLVGYTDLDHRFDVVALQEELGLRVVTREAVEDEAVVPVVLVEAGLDHLLDDFIGDQATRGDQALVSPTQCNAINPVRFRPGCAIPARSPTPGARADQSHSGGYAVFLEEPRARASLRDDPASEMRARGAVNVTEPVDPVIGRACDE